MSGTYYLLPTLLTILISFLIVRAGAIALMMTGMDKRRAVFQALSAFTGTGFTTREAERVTDHPARRKIISWLMVLGNAGIVTVIITATSSMVTSEGYAIPGNILFFLSGLYIIYRVASSRGVIKRWDDFIEDRLFKSRAFEEGAVEDLLHLIEGYGLLKVIVTEDLPVVDRSIKENDLTKGGVLVLGIERGRVWLPVPKPSEIIRNDDRLIIYGPLSTMKKTFGFD